MKAKEEKILNEYNGIDYGQDENGWIRMFVGTNKEVMNLFLSNKDLYDTKVENLPDRFNTYFRPKSLQGIENNNQWLVFDGIKNINNLDCWVFTDKKRTLLLETYLKFSSINEFEKITHFQEIKKPLNPIY